jgi:4a-hydroxytetrahydrobiopterin dehydratase
MADPLSDEAIESRLSGSQWQRRDDAIVREVTFDDFAQAIAYVNRVAEAAEAANHHPDISVHGYNHVTLSLSTHSAGGITDADFELAGRLDGLV